MFGKKDVLSKGLKDMGGRTGGSLPTNLVVCPGQTRWLLLCAISGILAAVRLRAAWHVRERILCKAMSIHECDLKIEIQI